MHLPSQYVCIHTQGCVCARDTEQSKEGMHNHTLVQDFQTTLEISLHAYLVFQCRQYLSSRLTWLPVWFLVNFISPPRQGRSSMIHTLHGSSLQCKCIHKKKKDSYILMLWLSDKTVNRPRLCFCLEPPMIVWLEHFLFSFSAWHIQITVIKSQHGVSVRPLPPPNTDTLLHTHFHATPFSKLHPPSPQVSCSSPQGCKMWAGAE